MQRRLSDKWTVDDEVARLLKILKTLKPESEEYHKVTNMIVLLYRTKSFDTTKFSISGDVVLTVIGATVQMLLIMNHEELHNITTKAFGWVIKGRI